MEGYETDLAWVHDAGFGDFARAAAPGLLALLRGQSVDTGLVVDLGCGSGIWARELTAAGYRVLGVDASAAMVDLARARAPHASFVHGSVLDVDLPACDAVTALGEVFNYAFDPRMGARALGRLLGRIRRALRPGGVLVFDLAEPGVEPLPRRGWRQEAGWAVLSEAVEDRARRRLERRITVFRQVDGAWRRSHEVHRLRLYAREQVVAALEEAGFRVRVLERYGRMPMLPGRAGFLAVKPRRRPAGAGRAGSAPPP